MRRSLGKNRLTSAGQGPDRSSVDEVRFAPSEPAMDGYILVVDDDADHRALLAETITLMGYPTEQAENGRVALDRLEEALPRLVLLDLKMPVMSGWAVLEALQQMPHAASIPVLVISAYGFEWEAELIGAAGYVGKPVDLEALRQKIEGLIGSPAPALLH